MSEAPTPQPVRPIAPARSSDTAVGASVLLAALAVGFVLLALWVIENTYGRYRGRTDLDMPDWFAINLDLMWKILPLTAAAGLCLLVSGALFFTWGREAGWVLRIGFGMQWLVSAIIVWLVAWSRFP